jgi:hypothetical protein
MELVPITSITSMRIAGGETYNIILHRGRQGVTGECQYQPAQRNKVLLLQCTHRAPLADSYSQDGRLHTGQRNEMIENTH